MPRLLFERFWIRPLGKYRARWHLASRHSAYWVAVCTDTKMRPVELWRGWLGPRPICKHCAAIIAKEKRAVEEAKRAMAEFEKALERHIDKLAVTAVRAEAKARDKYKVAP
jgi:hypothetical protein